MAVNQSRSMNAELHEGATDGSYKKIAPARGGVVEHTFVPDRTRLSPFYYGSITESPNKTIGDGTVRPTPGYISETNDGPNGCAIL